MESLQICRIRSKCRWGTSRGHCATNIRLILRWFLLFPWWRLGARSADRHFIAWESVPLSVLHGLLVADFAAPLPRSAVSMVNKHVVSHLSFVLFEGRLWVEPLRAHMCEQRDYDFSRFSKGAKSYQRSLCCCSPWWREGRSCPGLRLYLWGVSGTKFHSAGER